MRYRAFSRLGLALVAVLAASAAGCSNWAVVDEIKEGDYFNKPFVKTPDWLQPNRANKLSNLSKQGPVQPDELVNAAGQCAPKPAPLVQAQAAPPAQPPQAAAAAPEQAKPNVAEARAEAPVGSVAGDLASAPMPQGPPPAPPPQRKRLASAKAHGVMDGLQPEGTSSDMTGAGATPMLSGIALGMSECQVARRAGSPSHIEIGVGSKGERKVVLTYLAGPRPGIYTFDSGRLKTVDAAPGQMKAQEPKKKKRSRRVSASGHGDVYVQ